MTSSCWLWNQRIGRDGYGRLWVSVDGKRKCRLVHRLIWEEYFGPISADKEIHHLCNTRKCYNPAHLTLLTRREHRKTHRSLYCKKGIHLMVEPNLKLKNKKGRPLPIRYCGACDKIAWKLANKKRWQEKKLARTSPPTLLPQTARR